MENGEWRMENDFQFSIFIFQFLKVLLVFFILCPAICSAQTMEKVSGNTTDSITTVRLSETVISAKSKVLVATSDYGAININSQKLSKIPSILGVPDLIKVLQLMPGVQHSGEGNGHLYVRGADPGHNLMLCNNVPVYGTSHLTGMFPFYNTDHIDRIHFDKPGVEAQFGNRLGATVQALAPDQLPNHLSLRGNIGLAASQLTVCSPLGNKAGLVLSGRQTTVDQLITPVVNSFASNEQGIDELSYSFSDANLTLMLRPAENHNVDVNVFVSKDRFRIADEKLLLDGIMKWNNRVASVRWDFTLKKDVKLTQEVYLTRHTNHLRAQQSSVDLQVQSEILDWGFMSSAGFRLGSVPFTAGVCLANYHVKPQELLSLRLSNPGVTDHHVDALHFSTYLQAKLQINEYLSLDPGLRAGFYTSNDSVRENDFKSEPRISLNFTDNNRWTAYLSYARKSQRLHMITTSSVGFPTDFWIATSEGVPVELADNYSVGSVCKVSPRMELTTGLWYSRMNHQVHYPLNILQFNEITSIRDDLLIGKGTAYGAELMFRKTGRLSGWISYTWSKSDRQFAGIDNGQTFPSKFYRRHNLTLVANYEISKRWEAGLIQIYTSGNRFTAPESWYFINNNPVKEYGKYHNAQMPHYKRTDISVDFYVKRTGQRESVLNISVYNLFAVVNPVYILLDILSNESGSQIRVKPHYKSLYTILPSVGWRFKF